MSTERAAELGGDDFIGELRRWRDVRGVSQSHLARKVAYSPSYVSKVENGTQVPSRAFARQADNVLNAGGALLRAIVSRPTRPVDEESSSVSSAESVSSLLTVEHDDAELFYDGRTYRATQRRQLLNVGNHPVSRYLIRISVDRFPGSPERSNQLYRENPLTWDEIGLTASHGIHAEPMRWRVQHDRDAFKELWLLFENEYGLFPLYPGEKTWIEYSYTVGDEKWGPWFQRAVRLPTRHLSVRLDFPSELDPVVWGMETSMSAEAFPFRTAIVRQDDGKRRSFSWSTDEPPLHARYRLEWRFRGRHEDEEHGSMTTTTPAETMRAVGIVQEGDPILAQQSRPFDLPADAEDARRVVAELISAMERVSQVHTFSKGMGIAAPQIGIDRAAAVVRAPNSREVLTLLNPRIIEESEHRDEQYEGCLSFFDVRGMVSRPLAIHVEHQDPDGARRITSFDRGVARLVAHEIDHLNGVLYRERMNPGGEPLPVNQYRESGSAWNYS